MHNLQQAVKLVDRQVLDNRLRHGSEFFLCGTALQRLVDEVSVDLLERRVTAIDEVAEIFDGRRLVLDEDQDEVQT